MLKSLFIGDPHFQVDNIQDVEIFISKTYDLVQKEKFDFVCILGDLLHTHEKLHSVPLNKSIEFVTSLSNLVDDVIVLVGNHDMYSNQEYLNTNHWMNCLKTIPNVEIVDTVLLKTWKKTLNFIFVPYVYPGKFEAALNACYPESVWKASKCIVAHQEFFNCNMGAIKSVDGDVWSEHYPPVISGHIHNNQRVEPNIYYPGSALQHSFGDTGKNIVAIVTFTQANRFYDLKEVDLGLPRKKIIYSNVKDKIEIPVIKEGEKVRMTISEKQDEFKAFKKSEKYKKLVEKGVKVVFRPEKIDMLVLMDKQQKESTKQTSVYDFDEILKKLVDDANSKFVFEAYDHVVMNKKKK